MPAALSPTGVQIPFRHVLSGLTLAVLTTVTGCTRYQYEVLRPPEVSGAVATRAGFTTLELSPLVYHLSAQSGRLALVIENPTDTPIRLSGEQSVVVDPGGGSHPVRGQTIAPYSHARLILPPPPPTVRETGPTFGVGLGTTFGGSGRGRGIGTGVGVGLGTPRTYRVYDPDNPSYWRWEGESVARLLLAYRSVRSDLGVQPPSDDFAGDFTHDFAIARQRERR